MVEHLWELSRLDRTLALLCPVGTLDVSDLTCQREPLVATASWNGTRGGHATTGRRRLDAFGRPKKRLVKG